MAVAKTLPLALGKCLRQGFFTVDDPGASGTISIERDKGNECICEIVTAAAESRALPAVTGLPVGQRLFISLQTDGGDLTITGAATGNVTLDDAGEVALFYISDAGGTKQWNQLIAVSSITAAAFADNVAANWGTGNDFQILFSTGDASNHTAVIALDNTSQQLHVTDVGAKATDWARSAGTHPEIAIHSNTTPITDYLAIGNHDGTTAFYNVVGGTTGAFQIGGTTAFTYDAGGINFADSIGVAFGTGDDASILWDATNLVYDVDTGVHDFTVATTTVVQISASGLDLADSVPIRLGTGNDFTILFNGTDTILDAAVGGTIDFQLASAEIASVQATGLACGTYVAAGTAAGTDQLTLQSTGTAPTGTGANVGHLYADFETDDDELFWLSGTGGTASQLTT